MLFTFWLTSVLGQLGKLLAQSGARPANASRSVHTKSPAARRRTLRLQSSGLQFTASAELLEDRALLTTLVTFSDNVLTIDIGAAGESTAISVDNGQLHISSSDIGGVVADAAAQALGFAAATGQGELNVGDITTANDVRRIDVVGAAGTQSLVLQGGTFTAVNVSDGSIENVIFDTAGSSFDRLSSNATDSDLMIRAASTVFIAQNVSTGDLGTGASGNISISAPNLMVNGAQVSLVSGGGAIDLSGVGRVSSAAVGNDFLLDARGSAAGGAVALGPVGNNAGSAAYLHALSINTTGSTQSGAISFSGEIRLDDDGQGNAANFTAVGGGTLTVGPGVTIDTEQGHDAAGGSVSLDAGLAGTLLIQGQIDVSSTYRSPSGVTSGGQITLLGDRVGLLDAARLDASGNGGGGTILIGGDYQGSNPEVRNARRTTVAAGAQITADSFSAGSGGKVIVWSDEFTRFYGQVTSRGVGASGAGGFVEISGKQSLDARGVYDLSATSGVSGTLLFDPANIAISGGTNDGGDSTDSSATNLINNSGSNTQGSITFTDQGTGNPDPFVIYESEIESTNANIILQATTSITVTGTFGGSELTIANNRSLTLTTRNSSGDAAGNIDLTGSSDAASLVVRTQGTGSILIQGGTGDGTFASNINLSRLQSASGNITVSSGNGTINVGGDISTDGGVVNFSGSNLVVLARSVTIDTEQGDNGNSGAVSFGTSTITANAAGFDLLIDTSTQFANAGATGGAVTLGTVSGGFSTFQFVNDLTIRTYATTGGLVSLNGSISLNDDAGDTSSLVVQTFNDADNGGTFNAGDTIGNVVLGASITLDTEQGNDGSAGTVSISSAAISALSAGFDLAIDTSTTSAGRNGGPVLLNTVGNSGGNFLNDFTIRTFADSVGLVTLNGNISLDNFAADAGDFTILAFNDADNSGAFSTGDTIGSVLVPNSMSIDTEQGNNGNGGSVSVASSQMSASAAGRDLAIDTSTTSAAGTGGRVTVNAISNGGGAFLNDLTIRTFGTTAGQVDLNAAIALDDDAADAGDFTILAFNDADHNGAFNAGDTIGNVVLGTTITIDTEQGSNGNVGSVSVASSAISAIGAGFDLVISTSTFSATGTGGRVTLNSFGNGGGNFLNDLLISTLGTTAGQVDLNGTISLDNNGADTGDFTILAFNDVDHNGAFNTGDTIGSVNVVETTLVDTEQGDNGAGGQISFAFSALPGPILRKDLSSLAISAAPSITETNADQTATFTVTSPLLSGQQIDVPGGAGVLLIADGAFDVAISTTVGTAGAADYSLVTTSVQFAGTVGETQDVSVTIKGDTIVEANETFDIVLGALSNGDSLLTAAITSGDSATATITNDDTNTLSITAPVITETSVDQTVTFTVTSPNAVEGGFDVAISTTNGTAGSSDYALVTTTVHFDGTAGEMQTVSVTIKGETLVEDDETFDVVLGTVSGTTATQVAAITTSASAAATITNDDTATYTISNATATEGADLSFTVSLSNPVDIDTTVNVTFTNGTTAAGDFNHTTVPVTFLAGNNTAQVILVATVTDSTVEADETFTANLALTAPLTGGRLSNTIDTGAGTITNDDTATYSINNATIAEGGNLSFTVSLSNPVDIDTTINVTFSDGTTSAGDFNHTTVPVTFLAGINSAQVILISTVGDNLVEDDESLTASLTLSAPLTGGRFSDTTDAGSGTITNDDAATYSISNASIAEGGNLSFTVSLSNPVDVDTTVNVTFADVTTSAGDFNHTTVPVTFLAGNNTAQVIQVATVADTTVEADETLTASLALTAPLTGGRLGDTTDTGTGTITNDDTATYTISDAMVTEGGDLSFTVSLSNPVDVATTVNVTFTDGTTSADDFTHTPVAVTFLTGINTAQVILVATGDDNTVEGDETLTAQLALSTPLTGGRLGDTTDTGAGAILNDDTSTLTINNPTVVEGDSGTIALEFNVTSSDAVQGGFTVAFTVTGITADGTDYTVVTASPLSFTGAAGEIQTITVNVNGDTLGEDDETLSVMLGTVTPVVPTLPASIVSGAEGIGTIQNDDTVTYTINDVTVNEADGTLVFDLVADNPLDIDVTVDVTFTNGSASGSDYTSTTQHITFLAGETSKQVSVAINDDNIVEATEDFTAALSTATPVGGRTLILTDTATGTITDNDTATFTINNVTVGEAAGSLVFDLATDKPLDIDVTIDVTFTNGSATGGDYTSTTQHITFLAGETTQSVSVAINNDNIVEATESFSAALGAVTPLGGRTVNLSDTGTGTITDNDTATFTINNVTVGEAAGSLVFDLATDKPLDIDVTIDVTFTNGSAGGSDYTSTTQQITFLAGETSKPVSVAINDDNIVEATEGFSVALGTATPLSGRSIDLTDTGSGTITDNDTATFTIEDVTVGEGAGPLVFNLVTDKPLDIDVTITVTFTAGTATGGGTDFTSTTQQITFLAGETSKPVSVALNDDAIVEATESFTAAMSTSTVLGGRSVTTSDTATGTITDNDVATVSIAKVTDGAEANSPTNGKFRITQSAVSSTDTVVNYSIGGTATPGAGNDYTTLTGTATIPAGQTTVDINVSVLNDVLIEGTETVIVTLTSFGTRDPDITLDATPATVNITDNDVPTITSGATATVAENTPATTVVLNVDADPTPLAPGHTLSYSLSGLDSALFNIDSATGEIRFNSSPNFDVPADQDTNNAYQVTVTVTADTTPAQATSQNLTITVTPVNDILPVFTNPTPTFSIPENTADGTVVGSVPATDGDLPAQTLTYSIVSGNLGGAFTINPATGQITVAASTSLNFEQVMSFTLIVRVTDNTPTALTADATVTINVTNVVEAPTITVANPEGTYHVGRFPAMIFTESTYIYDDVAHPNYEGAKLTVSIASGRSRKDKLRIIEQGEGSGEINTRGRKVFLGATQIGTFKGGRGRNPDLVVTLNANATTAGVATLIRRVNFQAKDGVGTAREIEVQITNIAGVDSNIATREIDVVS